MSNSSKPTPTKSTTPKKSSNNASSNTNVTSGQNFSDKMSEENLYLFFEVLKRNMDNELIMKQKLEESYKALEERRRKYAILVSKYARLVKLAQTRKVLLQSKEFTEFSIADAQADANSINVKISSGNATDHINSTELTKFKSMLQQLEKYENIPIKRSELEDFQKATDAIQCSIETIEKTLEENTIQSLDHLTSSLSLENYPQLLSEYDFNENLN